MSVERRYGTRLAVDFELDVCYRGRRFHAARAVDLSAEGLLLETAALTLPTGTLVELDLRRRGRSWQFSAIVVHSGNGGVGLMFREPQTALYRDELEAAVVPAGCGVDRGVRPGLLPAAPG